MGGSVAASATWMRLLANHHEKIANEPRSTSNGQADLWVRRVVSS
jgi:hypothetical protein